MKHFIIPLLLIITILSGCGYKFIPEELMSIELHQSTNITDWDKDVFTKMIARNFTYADDTAKNITKIINDNGIQLGVYHRNKTCRLENIEPGFVEIHFETGTVMIEQDYCNPTSINNKICSEISSLFIVETASAE